MLMLTEKSFMPPRGTTVTRELTLAERKWRGKLNLAKFVCGSFNADHIRFKRNGVKFRFGFDSTNQKFRTFRDMGYFRDEWTYFENLTAVTKFLMTFDVTTILKIHKLGLKAKLDRRSVLGSTRFRGAQEQDFVFNDEWVRSIIDSTHTETADGTSLQVTNQITYTYGNPATV
jgi:hypothetical protein